MPFVTERERVCVCARARERDHHREAALPSVTCTHTHTHTHTHTDHDKQAALPSVMHVAPGQLVGVQFALKLVGGNAAQRDDDVTVCPVPFRLRLTAVVSTTGFRV